MTTENAVIEKPETFESETCSRCGGSGHYSYCQRYGTTCFRCGGKKRTLTKRGAAAANYLRLLRTRKAWQLKVGQLFRSLDVTLGGEVFNYWAKAESIEMKDGGLIITTSSKYGAASHHMAMNSSVRVAFSGVEAATTWAQAMDYQTNLTKAGTVRKRKA